MLSCVTFICSQCTNIILNWFHLSNSVYNSYQPNRFLLMVYLEINIDLYRPALTDSHCLALWWRLRDNRNRNLKTSKTLPKSQAHQGTSYFTNQSEVSKKVVKRSSGPISRASGGDRVAVKVGVVQMGRVNDQLSQGRSVWRDDILISSGMPGMTDKGAGWRLCLVIYNDGGGGKEIHQPTHHQTYHKSGREIHHRFFIHSFKNLYSAPFKVTFREGKIGEKGLGRG